MEQIAFGVCGVHLAEMAPDCVKPSPLGTIETRPTDAREPWRLSKPAAIIETTRAIGQDLPIDAKLSSDSAFYLIHPSDLPLSETVKLFRDWIIQEAKAG